MEEMKCQGAAGKSEDVLEMIQRLENQDQNEYEDCLDSDDEDEETAESLDQRVAGIDLEDADAIWEKLDEHERQEFKSLVYNNEFLDMIERKAPWWSQHTKSKLVQDEEEIQKELKEIMKSCPNVSKNIVDFNLLSKKDPHSCIIFNCCNVVAAYAYLFRYYNGDCHSYADEFVNSLIEISDNLRNDANFLDESFASVVENVLSNCSKSELPVDNDIRLNLYEDLKQISRGPVLNAINNDFVLSALSDCLNLLNQAQKLNRKVKNPETGTRAQSKFLSEFPSSHVKQSCHHDNITIKKCVKKVEYYLSFVKDKYVSEVKRVNICK